MGFIKSTFTIFKKETKSYFFSPMAYVIIGLFMFMSSLLFYLSNLAMGQSNLEMIFGNAFFGFILIIFSSIITMRIYAEDKKNGTEVLLFTSPSSVSSIILGKFLAAYLVFVVMAILTMLFPLTIVIFKGSFTFQMIGTYLNFFLFGACLISFGVFASALTENQIIAAIISFIGMLLFFILSTFSTFFGGVISDIIGWMSLYSRYTDSMNGILNLSTIVYFISFVFVILYSTVIVCEKRRWSQG